MIRRIIKQFKEGNNFVYPMVTIESVFDNKQRTILTIIEEKQDLLESNKNICTVDGDDIIGSGDLSTLPEIVDLTL